MSVETGGENVDVAHAEQVQVPVDSTVALADSFLFNEKSSLGAFLQNLWEKQRIGFGRKDGVLTIYFRETTNADKKKVMDQVIALVLQEVQR